MALEIKVAWLIFFVGTFSPNDASFCNVVGALQDLQWRQVTIAANGDQFKMAAELNEVDFAWRIAWPEDIDCSPGTSHVLINTNILWTNLH